MPRRRNQSSGKHAAPPPKTNGKATSTSVFAEVGNIVTVTQPAPAPQGQGLVLPKCAERQPDEASISVGGGVTWNQGDVTCNQAPVQVQVAQTLALCSMSSSPAPPSNSVPLAVEPDGSWLLQLTVGAENIPLPPAKQTGSVPSSLPVLCDVHNNDNGDNGNNGNNETPDFDVVHLSEDELRRATASGQEEELRRAKQSWFGWIPASVIGIVRGQ